MRTLPAFASAAESLPQAAQRIGLSDHMLLLGFVMYFVNQFTDANFGVPVGELFLAALAGFYVLREKSFSRIISSPGFAIAALLMCWIVLANNYNRLELSWQIRYYLAVLTLIVPVFCFISLKNKQPLVSYITGLVLAFGLAFMFVAGNSLLSGEIERALRGMQPTPVVPLALYVLLRKRISKPLGYALLAAGVFSFLFSFTIEARGPLLAPLIAFGLFLGARFFPFARFTVPSVTMLALIAHFLISLQGSAFDKVVGTEKATLSNLERAYAIDYSRMVTDASPWFGDSPSGYAVNFIDFFTSVSSLSEEGDQIASPHNTFLEYSVFCGYPAGILIVLMIGMLIHGSFYRRPGENKPSTATLLLICLAAAGIIRMGAFYGISGWLRIEWFALLYAIYAQYSFAAPTAVQQAPVVPFRASTRFPRRN